MLNKLLKYDLINAYKGLIVFYGLALFFAVFTRLFLSFENSLILHIIGQICGGVTVSMMFNIIINNMMRLWVKFRQNIFGDESYLTHTLPIKKQELYSSKFITAFITNITSIGIIVLSLYIAYGTKEVLSGIKAMLNGFSASLNITPFIIVIGILFILFIEFLNILQCGFTGLLLGHRRNNAKIGFSFLYGFIVYMLSQLFILIIVFSVALFDNDFMNLFVKNRIENINTIKAVTILATVGYTVICAVGYLINQKILKKGVNVD